MQCTREEIEEKRKLALRKLAENKTKCNAQNQTFMEHSKSPLSNKLFKFQNKTDSPKYKPYESSKTEVKSNAFYGKDKDVVCKLSLISEARFTVETTAFSTPVIDVFKTIPSRNYDPNSRNWDFSILDYNTLTNKLRLLSPHIIIERLPKYVLNSVQTKKSQSEPDLSRIDSELLNALMPFQREGVCFGIEKQGRCLIADDMGLGKTFQALGIAHYYKEDWPLLIVTTATMRNTWEQTILQYLPSISIMHVQYMVSGKDYIDDAKILIVSHDMMSRGLEKLVEKKFGVLIIDESHAFKNFKTKGTKAITKLADIAKRVILLSGTPALSRPSELFTQLSLLDPRFFGNFINYSKRYCDGKTTNFGWDANGQSNLTELEIVLAKKFMIRRTKENVLKALPNKTQELVQLDVNLNQFSSEDRECLKALAQKYNSEKSSGGKHAILLTFFSETAKIKIPSVISYILQTLAEDKKFLIFAHHQVMLDAIENILKQKAIKFIRIDGATTSDRRNYFINTFQVDDSYVCALLSITAANAGITLTAAQLVLFAELHWNPSILSQAESRAHRIGQSNPVVVKYLIAGGTADDAIWPMLQKKQKILMEAGLCKDTFDCSLSVQTHSDNQRITEGLEKNKLHTLDITNYFKKENKPTNSGLVSSVTNGNSSKISDNSIEFDDDLDDILRDIDF